MTTNILVYVSYTKHVSNIVFAALLTHRQLLTGLDLHWSDQVPNVHVTLCHRPRRSDNDKCCTKYTFETIHFCLRLVEHMVEVGKQVLQQKGAEAATAR